MVSLIYFLRNIFYLFYKMNLLGLGIILVRGSRTSNFPKPGRILAI